MAEIETPSPQRGGVKAPWMAFGCLNDCVHSCGPTAPLRHPRAAWLPDPA